MKQLSHLASSHILERVSTDSNFSCLDVVIYEDTLFNDREAAQESQLQAIRSRKSALINELRALEAEEKVLHQIVQNSRQPSVTKHDHILSLAEEFAVNLEDSADDLDPLLRLLEEQPDDGANENRQMVSLSGVGAPQIIRPVQPMIGPVQPLPGPAQPNLQPTARRRLRPTRWAVHKIPEVLQQPQPAKRAREEHLTDEDEDNQYPNEPKRQKHIHQMRDEDGLVIEAPTIETRSMAKARMEQERAA